MTTYSHAYIVKLEETLSRIENALTTLSNDREQVKMVRHIQHILAEVRVCSSVLNLPDEVTQPDSLKAKAVDRLLGIFDTYK